MAADGSLIPDPRGRLPGRGAHLHPTPECLTLAERRSAFPRALRVPGPLDVTALRAWIASETQHRDDPPGSQHRDDPAGSKHHTDPPGPVPASPAPHRPHDRESRDEHPMNTQP